MQAHASKGFPLKEYGLLMHMPAVRAELCMSEVHARHLHDMLSTLRLIKTGADKGRIKANALPLPRVEPWSRIVQQATPTLLLLQNNRRSRQHQAIEIRGERGDGRGYKPEVFLLSCPSCGQVKDCAKHRLYTNNASCITCRGCHRNTTSIRWRCNHNVPWHQCLTHREHVFWCGTAAIPPAGSGCKRPDPTTSEARHVHKRRRLGSLGQGDQRAPTYVNSAASSSNFENKRNKKENNRYGDRLPPKGEVRRSSWAWQAHTAERGGVPGVCSNPDSDHPSSQLSEHLPGAKPQEPLESQPSKRVKLDCFKQVPACRGQCPTVWTIHQYCPHCHG